MGNGTVSPPLFFLFHPSREDNDLFFIKEEEQNKTLSSCWHFGTFNTIKISFKGSAFTIFVIFLQKGKKCFFLNEHLLYNIVTAVLIPFYGILCQHFEPVEEMKAEFIYLQALYFSHAFVAS